MFFAQLFLSFAAGMTGGASVGSLGTRLAGSLLLVPIYATLLGVPMALFVSRRRTGFFASGALGAAVFAVPIFGFVFGAALSVGVRIDSRV